MGFCLQLKTLYCLQSKITVSEKFYGHEQQGFIKIAVQSFDEQGHDTGYLMSAKAYKPSVSATPTVNCDWNWQITSAIYFAIIKEHNVVLNDAVEWQNWWSDHHCLEASSNFYS